jgi:hypothetical protein
MSTQGFHLGDLVFAWKWGTEGHAGKSVEEQQRALASGQSVFFITLVVAQLGNLISIRKRRLPYFYTPPKPAPATNPLATSSAAAPPTSSSAVKPEGGHLPVVGHREGHSPVSIALDTCAASEGGSSLPSGGPGAPLAPLPAPSMMVKGAPGSTLGAGSGAGAGQDGLGGGKPPVGHLGSSMTRVPVPPTPPSKVVIQELDGGMNALPGVLRIVCSCVAALVMAVLFTEVPEIAGSMKNGPVPGKHWGIAFVTAAIILAVSEGRKWWMLAFPSGFVARMAW